MLGLKLGLEIKMGVGDGIKGEERKGPSVGGGVWLRMDREDMVGREGNGGEEGWGMRWDLEGP